LYVGWAVQSAVMCVSSGALRVLLVRGLDGVSGSGVMAVGGSSAGVMWRRGMRLWLLGRL
jgi:hypothetical protein